MIARVHPDRPNAYVRPAGHLRRILLAGLLTGLAACGGGGGDSGGNPVTPPPGGSNPVTISGIVTYDRVPARTNGSGLDYGATLALAVRGAEIQALDSAGNVLDQSTTSASGAYSLTVPGDTQVRVRVRARLLQAGTPGWDVSVVDNTSGDALYVLDGAPFDAGSGATGRDLHAPSGWNGSDYVSTRAAAPFAILDTIRMAMETVLAVDADAEFPSLTVKWSRLNVPTDGDEAAGQIGTTFYRRDGSGAQIFVLGAEDNDTDEYDTHIVLHEWGHFFEDAFSRSDSVGGPHAGGDRLDPRVAFSEGWGYAFAGIASSDPVTRDTAGGDQQLGFTIDVEQNANSNPGWYSEGSAQSILYDLVDPIDDGVDSVTLGFQPVYDVMVSQQRSTPALTTLFTFLTALRAAEPASVAGIDAIVAAQDIDAAVVDDFGSAETNDAGNSDDVLPVYTPIVADGPSPVVCSIGGPTGFGVNNKLSNRRFLVTDLPASDTYRITVTGPAGSDPDVVAHQGGFVDIAQSEDDGLETLTVSLGAGTAVIEVYEFGNITPGAGASGRTCLSVSLTRL